jgi:hypothetical protein
VVATEPVENVAALGSYYMLTTGSQSVATNGYLVVQISNPTGSGKVMHVETVLGSAVTETTLDVIRNGSFAATGTTLTPRNANTSFNDSSVMTEKFINQATDPTTGGFSLLSSIQTGGSKEFDFNGSIIITANNTLIIRLANNANKAAPMSISISWWELSTST